MIIAIEGIDRAGKSTLCEKLQKLYNKSIVFPFPTYVINTKIHGKESY